MERLKCKIQLYSKLKLISDDFQKYLEHSDEISEKIFGNKLVEKNKIKQLNDSKQNQCKTNILIV